MTLNEVKFMTILDQMTALAIDEKFSALPQPARRKLLKRLSARMVKAMPPIKAQTPLLAAAV